MLCILMSHLHAVDIMLVICMLPEVVALTFSAKFGP